jgi:molecular chaperone Hsp33
MNPTDMFKPDSAQPDPAGPDQVRRFILEDHPVRGHWVRIEEAWRAVREHKQYPPVVQDLLGQAVCASVLLAATLKFRGTLTLQLQGKGAVNLLVSQCTHDFRIRAVARYSEEVRQLQADNFHQLVGDEGRVVVTVESSERDTRYQGIVPLTGSSLAECLEAYFASSEQLPTRVRLAADEGRAVGLLVQKLPTPENEDEFVLDDAELSTQSAWRDAQIAVAAVSSVELLNLSVQKLLTDRIAGRDVRLFKPQSVQFQCRCSEERVTGILRALGESEVRDVLQEQGSVTVTCDYCDRPYRFGPEDVERLFSPTFVASAPPSLQ